MSDMSEGNAASGRLRHTSAIFFLFPFLLLILFINHDFEIKETVHRRSFVTMLKEAS
jgi:hypothetical protein